MRISPPLAAAFERHLHQLALSPATIRNYMADLSAFARWLDDHRRAPRPQASRSNGHRHADSTLTPRAFRDYRAHLLNETDHTPATINRRLQSLRSFGRFLYEKGRLARSPVRELALVPNGKLEPAAPRTLDREETARLLEAVRENARPSLLRRDYAIVQLMLQAGLRVNEVAACRGDDLVLSREGMHLRVESPRGAIREVPLNETLARAVRDYLSVRPNTPEVDQLFVGQGGRPLSTRAIQRLIETYAAAANLKAVCAQHLRHTCAQRMLAETHDPELVAQWLGKRSVAGLEKFAREA